MRHITAVLALFVSIASHAGAAEPVPPATTLNPSSNPQVKRGCDLVLASELTQASPSSGRSLTRHRPT